MKEILGSELTKMFNNTGIKALKTYTSSDRENNTYEVWELTDEEFEKLCAIQEDDWQDDWGWWRYDTGSNRGTVEIKTMINNKLLWCWKGFSDDEEMKSCDDYDFYNLLEYFCSELGASQPRNVCALAVDLAKQNKMKLSELFQKYQG